MTHNPSKEAAAKKFFSSVYVIGATYFNEYFLSHVKSGRCYFFLKACHDLQIFSTAIVLFSFKQAFSKKSFQKKLVERYLH